MHSSSPPPAPEDPATAEEAVMAAMMSLGRRIRHRFPGDEIDFASMPILKTLHLCGPMRLSSLAGQLQLDASTVSRHARQLEDRGLLDRTEDPDDGRASRVMVSEHGVGCLERVARTRLDLIASVLDGWPDADREQLRVLLARLNADLVAGAHSPVPATSQENS